MSVSLRVGIGAVLLSLVLLALAGPAAAGRRDGRIRVDAVHDWLVALREPVDDPQEMPTDWATASAGLAKIGPDDRAVLPVLIVGLQDHVPRVRAAAADAIGRIGPEAKSAVPALRALLPKPGEEAAEDALVIQSAIAALGQIGDEAVCAADDLVLRFAGFGDWQAQNTLERFGPAAVPALARGLQDSRAPIRQKCLTTLAAIDCAAPVALERELELLGDQAEVRRHTGCMVASMPVGRAAVPALLRRGTSVIEPLRKRLASENPIVRMRAACALARLKVFDQAVADRLAEAYRKEDLVEEAAEAIYLAKRMEDKRFLSALHRLLSDRDAGVRDCAASALIALNVVDDDVMRTEIGLLSHREFSLQAAEVLARLRERLKPFVPQLAEIARHGEIQRTRWVAAGLLACTVPDDPAVAANLAEMQKVRSSDARLQHSAVLATRLMGERGFPTLCQYLHHYENYGLPDFVSPDKSFNKLLIAEIRRAAAERDRTWQYVSLLLELASTNCSGEELTPCLPILIAHVCPPSTIPFPDPGNDPAAACIQKCGKAALPALISKLRDRQVTNERLTAIIPCLARLGPAARETLPLLLSSEMRGRVDSPVTLAQAIDKIGPTPECLPLLLGSAGTGAGYGGDTHHAIVTLGERALPGVVHLLESDQRSARLAGADLILNFREKAHAGIPAIVAILARGAGDEASLLQILATFGPPARAAVPVVTERLNSRFVRVRAAACVTLARIAAGSKEARAAVTGPLLAATQDDFAEVRAAAADALGLLGTPDSAVQRAIEPLRHDSFATVRNAAERASHGGDARYGAQSKVWTLYFDGNGPATGSLFTVNE